jgi:hypothetical protein
VSTDLVVFGFVVASVLSSACMLPEVQSRRDDAGLADREGAATGAVRDGAAHEEQGGGDAKSGAAIAGQAMPPPLAGVGGTSGSQMAAAAAVPDPCTLHNGGCDTSPLARCTSRAGAVTNCGCPAGYEGDGQGEDGCVDIDECVTENGGCDTMPRATCTNRAGAVPTCSCPSGSSGEGWGSDGCKPISLVVSPVVGPCGKFTCTEQVVEDPTTRLTWQRQLPMTYDGCTGLYERNPQGTKGDACSWEEAMGYCAQLALASGGWRLPTKDELLSIVDTSRTDPSIDLTAFPNTHSDAFWSTSPYVSPPPGNLEGAWYIIFRNGAPYNDHTEFGCRVRCVR